MTYGSPKSLNDIPNYLKKIYGGKEPPLENIAEFKRRYSLIKGSPLIQITQNQARALEKNLNSSKTHLFKVTAGMRFSHPFIKDAIPKLTKGADQIIGIIMSPQYSPIIMEGYEKELKEAVSKLNNPKLKLNLVKDWHLQQFFLEALAQRVNQALKKAPSNTPVLFTAHSMPKRVIDKEPDYIKDLKETAKEVAKLTALDKDKWMFCYQSAGHTPEEWLKPDFEDLMPTLKKKGYKSVLIAPVQFLADHLEVLYDIDLGAREQAEKNGLKFYRTKSLNTSPLFIKALAQIVKESAGKAI